MPPIRVYYSIQVAFLITTDFTVRLNYLSTSMLSCHSPSFFDGYMSIFITLFEERVEIFDFLYRYFMSAYRTHGLHLFVLFIAVARTRVIFYYIICSYVLTFRTVYVSYLYFILHFVILLLLFIRPAY